MGKLRSGAHVLLMAGALTTANTQEWPGLRGPNHDGSAGRGSGFGAGDGAMAVRWRVKLGSGYSGVAVSNGQAVTLFSDGANDVLAAFDAASGKERWRVAVGETHKGLDGSFNGPMATPVVAGGRVFALGPHGQLLAVDLAKGRVLWQANLPERIGAKPPHYGFASSPIVAAGVLVAQVGAGRGAAIAGFDPETGERRWSAGEDQVQYQSPVLHRLGEREIVVAAGDARLTGLDALTGRLLFDHPHGGGRGEISVASAVPLPAGAGRVFVKTHGDKSTMFRLVEAADGTLSVEPLWSAPVLRTTYVVPVYHDGHLYGMNARNAVGCVDAATGELKWRSREPGDGFPTLVGDRIVFVTKEGTLHVGAASPLGWSESARLELFQDLVWTAASVVGDALYARSLGELARVDWKPRAAPTVAASSLPKVASPTFARFLAELERATEKASAVTRFLAGVGDGPLIDPPDRVVFLFRGDAKDVGIATDLIGIRREDPLQRVPGTDLFFYEARVEPGSRVNYQFVRDFGRPMPDPRNPRRVPAFALGPVPAEEASSLAMPGWRSPAHLADAPDDRRGRIEKIAFASSLRPALKTSLHAYLPVGYESSRDRMPTVYILDGDGAREYGLLARSLDNLMSDRLTPALVIFVGGIPWTPAAPDATASAVEVLVKEIVPRVDGEFRTLAQTNARAVVGHGPGGIGAIRAAFDDSGLFGGLGLQSLVALDTDENDLKPRVRTAGARPLRLYHDWGMYGHGSTREGADMRVTNQRFNAYLRSKGYAPAGGEAKDGVGWASWRNRTDTLLEALLPAR